MNDVIILTLSERLQKRGTAFLQNTEDVETQLAIICGAYHQERTALSATLRYGVGESLHELGAGGFPDVVRERLIEQVRREGGLGPGDAVWAVRGWETAILASRRPQPPPESPPPPRERSSSRADAPTGYPQSVATARKSKGLTGFKIALLVILSILALLGYTSIIGLPIGVWATGVARTLLDD